MKFARHKLRVFPSGFVSVCDNDAIATVQGFRVSIQPFARPAGIARCCESFGVETVGVFFTFANDNRLSARFGFQNGWQVVKHAVNSGHVPKPFTGPGRVGVTLLESLWFKPANLKNQFAAFIGVIVSLNQLRDFGGMAVAGVFGREQIGQRQT